MISEEMKKLLSEANDTLDDYNDEQKRKEIRSKYTSFNEHKLVRIAIVNLYEQLNLPLPEEFAIYNSEIEAITKPVDNTSEAEVTET